MVSESLKAVSLPIEKNFFKNSFCIRPQVVICDLVSNQALPLSFKEKGKSHNWKALLETLFKKIVEHISKNASTFVKGFSDSSLQKDGSIWIAECLILNGPVIVGIQVLVGES